MLRRRRAVPPQQCGGLPCPAAGGSGCYSGPAGVPLPPGRPLTYCLANLALAEGCYPGLFEVRLSSSRPLETVLDVSRWELWLVA